MFLSVVPFAEAAVTRRSTVLTYSRLTCLHELVALAETKAAISRHKAHDQPPGVIVITAEAVVAM